jgi:hypothetical protein
MKRTNVLNVIHRSDGGISFSLLRETHKAESTATACVSVLDYDGFFDLTILLEFRTEGGIIGMPCEAANEQLGHSVVMSNGQRSTKGLNSHTQHISRTDENQVMERLSQRKTESTKRQNRYGG